MIGALEYCTSLKATDMGKPQPIMLDILQEIVTSPPYPDHCDATSPPYPAQSEPDPNSIRPDPTLA